MQDQAGLALQEQSYLPFSGVENDYTFYLPLDPISKDIRYLKLHAGGTGDVIRCSLGHTVLDKSRDDYVPYTALSYCWGDVNDTVEIGLSFPTEHGTHTTQSFRITRNLHTALVALRMPSEDRIFWVDAICISQKDPKEKTHQVGLLSMIFSFAEQVLVWLGEEDPSSRMLMRFQILVRIPGPWNRHSLLDQIDRIPAETLISLWEKFITSATEEPELRGDLKYLMGVTPTTEAMCKVLYNSIAQFLLRPWFRRIWVFQEVLLCPRGPNNKMLVTVQAGKSTMSWNAWTALTRLCFKAPCVQDYERSGLTWFNGAWYKATTLGGHANYIYYFDRTRKFLSTDPRDKLFALLHIATDTRGRIKDTPAFEPNYNKTLCDIVLDLADQGITVPMLLRTSLQDTDQYSTSLAPVAAVSFRYELLYPADPYAKFEFYDSNPSPFARVPSAVLPYRGFVITKIARKLDLQLGRDWCKRKGLHVMQVETLYEHIFNEVVRACTPLVDAQDRLPVETLVLNMLGIFTRNPDCSQLHKVSPSDSTWFWTLACTGSWSPRNGYGAPQLFITTDNRLILGSNAAEVGDVIVKRPGRNLSHYIMAAGRHTQNQMAGDYMFEGRCSFYPGRLASVATARIKENHDQTNPPVQVDSNLKSRKKIVIQNIRTGKSDEHTDFEDLVGGTLDTLALKDSYKSLYFEAADLPLSMIIRTKKSSLLQSEDVKAPATRKKSRLRVLKAMFTRQRS